MYLILSLEHCILLFIIPPSVFVTFIAMYHRLLHFVMHCPDAGMFHCFLPNVGLAQDHPNYMVSFSSHVKGYAEQKTMVVKTCKANKKHHCKWAHMRDEQLHEALSKIIKITCMTYNSL